MLAPTYPLQPLALVWEKSMAYESSLRSWSLDLTEPTQCGVAENVTGKSLLKK